MSGHERPRENAIRSHLVPTRVPTRMASRVVSSLRRGHQDGCAALAHFVAQEIPHRAWASIGSGSDIPAYQAELEKVTGGEARPLVALEASNPGGHARAMAFFVTQAVGDMPPVEGISKHFHIGVVLAHGWELRTSDRTQFRGGPPEEIHMPPVAESWAELGRLLAPHLTGALAVAA